MKPSAFNQTPLSGPTSNAFPSFWGETSSTWIGWAAGCMSFMQRGSLTSRLNTYACPKQISIRSPWLGPGFPENLDINFPFGSHEISFIFTVIPTWSPSWRIVRIIALSAYCEKPMKLKHTRGTDLVRCRMIWHSTDEVSIPVGRWRGDC